MSGLGYRRVFRYYPVLVLLVIALLAIISPVAAIWTIQTVDSTDDVGKYYPSLALDFSDNPHISYYDYTNQDLKYASWTGTAWNIETIDSTGDVGMYTSLALDSSGYPHISYRDYTNKALKYASWDGTAWNIETVDNVGNVGVFWTSLDLDKSDNPHISYYGYVNKDLMYASWTGSAWKIETVDSGGDVGMYSSLKLNSSDYPYISYYNQTEGDLKYAEWSGTEWLTETVDSTGDVGSFTSMALDKTDCPDISYYDATNDRLMFTEWYTAKSEWTSEPVNAAGEGGIYCTSIQDDKSWDPHIAYYDASSGDLKYAWWDGMEWAIESVDTAHNVGMYAVLVLDSSDNPHIAYYDVTNGDLKYAVGGIAINPSFSASAVSGTAPLTVTFTDTTTDSHEVHIWSFGDGGYSFKENPSHTFAAAGTYYVTFFAGEGTTFNATAGPGPVVVSAASSTGSSSGSSSSGGDSSSDGGTATSSGTGTTASKSALESGVDVNVGGGTAIIGAVIYGSGNGDAIVTATKLAEPGSGVSAPSGAVVYEYYQISAARTSAVSGADISFTVPQSWLEAHHVSPANIVLFHYDGGKWGALPTQPGATSNGFVTFTATTTGFSLYAIASLPGAAATTTMAGALETTGVSAEQSLAPGKAGSTEVSFGVQTTAPAQDETAPGFPLVTVALIGAGGVVLVVSGVYVRRWWVRRQNPALFKKYD